MSDQESLTRWLQSEESGDEQSAEAAFAGIYAAVGRIEASPEFVARMAALGSQARARRRRAFRLAWAAAGCAAAAAMAVVTMMAAPAGVWAVKVMALAISDATPWLVAYSTEAFSLWWFIGRVGGPIASALASPVNASALVGVELVGMVAFYALYRVIRLEVKEK